MIVIGLLRLAGLLNAAIWFGATFFFTALAGPSIRSRAMVQLIGENNFPYFSVAIDQLIGGRFFNLFLICATVAMLHTGAEWLYFGKYPKRFWVLLIFTLFLGGLAQSYGIQPKLKTKLFAEHNSRIRAEEREAAARSFSDWHALSTCLNVVLLGGLGIYLWRVANPPDEMRFVGATSLPGKFRS